MSGSSPGMTGGFVVRFNFQTARPSLRAKRSNPSCRGKEDGLLRSARNDVDMVSHTALSSRREAPEGLLLAPAQRGRGECRMPNAPAASCAIVVIERTRVITSTPESPGIPARNGFTAYVVLSRLLPPSPREYGFV